MARGHPARSQPLRARALPQRTPGGVCLITLLCALFPSTYTHPIIMSFLLTHPRYRPPLPLIAPSPGAQANEWSSSITFFLNGKKITLEASQVHPRMMLSEYLREHTQLTGTKVRGKHQQYYTTLRDPAAQWPSCAVLALPAHLQLPHRSGHVAVALP